MADEFLYAEGQMNGRTDMTKLLAVFLNSFTNAPYGGEYTVFFDR